MIWAMEGVEMMVVMMHTTSPRYSYSRSSSESTEFALGFRNHVSGCSEIREEQEVRNILGEGVVHCG